MGKTPTFCVRVRFGTFGFIDDKGSVMFGVLSTLQIMFLFGSSSVNVGFGSGSVRFGSVRFGFF